MATNPPTATFYPAERNLFGRFGKLYVADITAAANGDQSVGNLRWLANVTEITATMTIDRLEVRRSGDRFVKYKAGEVTGEGSLTMDKVNSDFEKVFIDYVNRASTANLELPTYQLHLAIEDSGIPNITFDKNGFAESGHEEIILDCVNFWSMPFGFSLSDMITRDLDFTFTSISYGGDDANPHLITDPAQLPTRIC